MYSIHVIHFPTLDSVIPGTLLRVREKPFVKFDAFERGMIVLVVGKIGTELKGGKVFVLSNSGTIMGLAPVRLSNNFDFVDEGKIGYLQIKYLSDKAGALSEQIQSTDAAIQEEKESVCSWIVGCYTRSTS